MITMEKHLVLKVIMSVIIGEDGYYNPLTYYVKHTDIEGMGIHPMHQMIPLTWYRRSIEEIGETAFYRKKEYENGNWAFHTVMVNIGQIVAVEVHGHALIFEDMDEYLAYRKTQKEGNATAA